MSGVIRRLWEKARSWGVGHEREPNATRGVFPTLTMAPTFAPPPGLSPALSPAGLFLGAAPRSPRP